MKNSNLPARRFDIDYLSSKLMKRKLVRVNQRKERPSLDIAKFNRNNFCTRSPKNWRLTFPTANQQRIKEQGKI